MKQIIAILLTLLPLTAFAQEERIDTVIPKFLSNGYFFREMPQLPDGEKTLTRLKDKEGNSIMVINVDAKLPKSLIRKAIPREQVHNADQFLNGLNIMATMTELTQAGVKPDGTFYSPQPGESFPLFSEKDMEGNTWTNDSSAEMPELSTWKEQLPNVMFFSATFHDAETAKRITDKHHFTWTHLVEAKDMMSWIGTEGFPLTIVVDKKGIVRYAVHGTNETTCEKLLTTIKEAEAE